MRKKADVRSLRERGGSEGALNILVYGAGVLGSLYAARLEQSGCNVSILARGQRFAELRAHGILLEDTRTGKRTHTQVNVVERLALEDAYDLVIVLMGRHQVSAVLPILAANRRTPNILFMVNNAADLDAFLGVVDRERILLGFAGAGGTREAEIVRYRILSSQQQATTLGELDGCSSPRLDRIVSTFKQAGFPVETSPTMDAWLKTHVAWIIPVATALYLAGGDNYRLARTRDAVVLMVRAIRENFRVLRASGIPITPSKLNVLEWLPEPLLVAFLRLLFDTKMAELVFTRHANAARDEMKELADELKALTMTTSVPTPMMDRLFDSLDPSVPPIAQGSAQLPLHWLRMRNTNSQGRKTMRMFAFSLIVSLYRLSGGRIGGTWGKNNLLLLTTMGRKSGQPRTVPVAYIRDGDAYVITASAGGSPRHPGWFFNLRSNQEVTIQVRKEVLSATAEIASPEKRRELWSRLLQIEPGFARYEKRATGREIPMVLVRPANGT